MKLTYPLASLLCGALLALTVSQARAEGAFDIPARRAFQSGQACEGNRVLQERGWQPARSPAANVLIRQRGKEGLSRNFGVHDVVSRRRYQTRQSSVCLR